MLRRDSQSCNTMTCNFYVTLIDDNKIHFNHSKPSQHWVGTSTVTVVLAMANQGQAFFPAFIQDVSQRMIQSFCLFLRLWCICRSKTCVTILITLGHFGAYRLKVLVENLYFDFHLPLKLSHRSSRKYIEPSQTRRWSRLKPNSYSRIKTNKQKEKQKNSVEIEAYLKPSWVFSLDQ